jgi:uncharacterized protein YprB with RNaseH-like and TPR domain
MYSSALAAPEGFSRGVNQYGDVYFRDEFFALDHLHGKVPLGEALQLHPEFIDRLGDFTDAELASAAYLDIETGGPSTHAFLVGVGTFEGLYFRVRQFFLAGPFAEDAMLMALTETLERCRVVVTYNGKSFDLPQLAMRYDFAGLPSGALDLPHVDLLLITRRLFARTLGSCRLADVERRLLRLKRQGDVPSSAIPGLYANYLRRANLRALHPVFEHNLLDVLSLPAAMAYLGSVAGEFEEDTAVRHLALGRWDESRGRIESAIAQYRAAWQTDPDGTDGGEAVWRLAKMLRCDPHASMAVWQEEASRTKSVSRRVRALIELSNLHERRLRNHNEALSLCLEALEIVQDAPSSLFVKTRPQLEKRIERLQMRRPASPRPAAGS